MPAAFRLQAVLEVAQRRLEVATGELQTLAVRRREAQDKLQQLDGFQAEYRSALQRGLEQGIEADRLRDFRAFLVKLERAIALQASELQRCTQAWEAMHQRWLDLRKREEALSVLQRRHLAAEQLREARNEQKQHDEFAQRERSSGAQE